MGVITLLFALSGNKAIDLDVSECIRVQQEQAGVHLTVLNRRNPCKNNGQEKNLLKASAFLNGPAMQQSWFVCKHSVYFFIYFYLFTYYLFIDL